MSKDSKKIVLTNQPSSSSSSSLGIPLPINNRFTPISPFSSRPRSPIPIVTPNPISFRFQSCSTPEEMQRIISEIKKNSPSQSRNSTTDDNILQDSQDPYEDIGPI
ncbi:hypothetical protein E3N88_38654 [Mikania micrantha]|uniref:Uncharacterized protein n=1 Tax=Mikania micrantha TaxID=192012 RepID=A0A5N6LUN2_9ASTR|nr:hypothetical protein E3N88_38654 [Mikania micrantha]